MEYLDIYNKYGEKTGEVIERDEAHRNGTCHRVIHLWIMNMQNEILIQNSIDDDVGMNFWYVSVGGHIESGERIETTLIRETKEELGLDISHVTDFIEYLFTFKEHTVLNNGAYNEFEIYDVFALRFNFDLNQITLQKDEVESVRLISYKDFKHALISKDKSFWHHDIGFKMLLIALDNFLGVEHS